MDLRHLDTLVAIADEGSFTGAADALNTVQSNVSQQVRQLEEELGAPLLVRSRRGAVPTECGEAVVQAARRIRRELELLREDLAALQGLQVGSATLGIVGTASRWLVPELVAHLRRSGTGVHLRVNEGASERLTAEVLDGELSQAVLTEPVVDRRLTVTPLLKERLVGLAALDADLPEAPVPIAAIAGMALVLPPENNPLRREIEDAAARQRVALDVPVEVEGIRLIADLVAASGGVTIMPETAVPQNPAHAGLRVFALQGVPPRRLALVAARDGHLSIADRAVREGVLRIVEAHRPGREGATVARGRRTRKGPQ